MRQLHMLDDNQNSRLLKLFKVEVWMIAITVLDFAFE